MKKAICLILVLLMAAGLVPALADKYEGDGFATPQEAVRAYVEALNAGDVPAAMATFATETYLEHYDTQKALERSRGANIHTYYFFPVTGPLGEGLKLERRRAEISQGIYNGFVYFTVAGTDFAELGEGNPVIFKEDEKIDAFISVAESNSAERYVGKIAIGAVLLSDDPAVQALLDAQKKEFLERINGVVIERLCCDELAEAAAVIVADGIPCIQFMQCARYGDKWFNVTLRSDLLSLFSVNSFTGGILPMSALGIDLSMIPGL